MIRFNPHQVRMETVPPWEPDVLPAVAHMLAVIDAARVIDSVPFQTGDNVVDGHKPGARHGIHRHGSAPAGRAVNQYCVGGRA